MKISTMFEFDHPLPSIVLDPAPPERGTAAPSTFRPMCDVYCGQTAGWIRVTLGTEVGLGPNGRPSQQLLGSCHFS